ncbi:MAG: ATP-dependent zinc metalloprotease FtsH [Gammaproteobacteria bacterium]|nr:ATP-dependent zinc metalloprotease FtsH [Gammaproteobacteria bacterium]NIR83238.1 ATP-dependent zinc metalloprotease FtsH [Gammaproteobacteria bacterium]NIR91042.1 ATP-dependent zinc metalloprotease FtsH [Gammaproteobacteria bacterium]NIU04403.1 ATP-dependent zinc metalloprotease FtsH [Gammaproteobacteria bacterium]NIV76358.1 ATP-dependent zinc metalloprotease FtsH [Gammaproteobacteria bacterium]
MLLRILLGILLTTALLATLDSPEPATGNGEVAYSAFLEDVRDGEVREVVIQGQDIQGVRADGTRFQTYAPHDPGLVGDLLEAEVTVKSRPPEEPSALARVLVSWFPLLLLLGVMIYFLRRRGGPMGSGLTGFGRSQARQLEEGQVQVTLSDVAGVEEAKEEVSELVEFLRAPDRFRQLGGNIPRGVLMVGPPGTGKTLLARAIAGEARVPFFTVSGSDFVEMFVGVGASRVRDLFRQAKSKAPCIIFIDEIDAVGRHRGAGLGGGHDEREQTLNQLLVEMDGFEGNEGVIVIAATNRPDVLDPALLRPGRFDRQVVVPLPDVMGRAQILKLHMRKVPIAPDVDAHIIARGTPGFSGADLANLVNEAALLAARFNSRQVDMRLFEQAKDKLLMGAERRSLVMTEEDKRRAAYHEAGHTIVGRLVPEHDPVHKVSIIPRGRALGVTLFLPERDKLSASKRALESQIATLFGGRLAEEQVFGADAVTTGAENDIERATQIARHMVTRWGFSEKLGPLSYNDESDEVFLGRAMAQPARGPSSETARAIDEEVRAIVLRNYEHARGILSAHTDTLHRMAQALMAYETLAVDQIDDIMDGREPRAPYDNDPDGGHGAPRGSRVPGARRKPRPRPPVVGPAAGLPEHS